jgi:lipopolysaccharide heptosyltransferase II
MNERIAIPSPPPNRILVRGVNWLGDAVMTMPALLRLRQAHPDARITLLTHEKLAELWPGHPAVDRTILFGGKDGVWTVARKLRPEGFQVGLALPNSHRSALELWLAGVPQRVGYGAPFRNWLLTRPIRPRPGAARMRKRSPAEIRRLIRAPGGTAPRPYPVTAHHTRDYLHLAAALGANPEPLAPCLAVRQEQLDRVRTRFGLTADQSLFGVNPGAEFGPAKRWPRDRFVAAMLEVQRQTRGRWLVFGGPREIELAEAIVRAFERADRGGQRPDTAPAAILNLAGQTALGELCALLKCCRVLLTNDTGPMHLAAAVGTPVVALFGSTSPVLTAPGLPGETRHRLLTSNAPCAPCFLRECPIDFRCLTGITVERAVQAVLESP